MRAARRIVISLAFLAALGALTSAPLTPAAAFGQYMCHTPPSGAARNVVTNASHAYSLYASGCAFINAQDASLYASNGFVPSANLFSVLVGPALTNNTASPLALPANAFIQNIIIAETAGIAATGGVDIGTTTGGQQIVAAVAVGGNVLVNVSSSGTRLFATPTQIYVQCHSG